MQTAMTTIIGFVALLAIAQATEEQSSPVQKVVQLLSDLEAKITGEGAEAHKTYADFAEFCEDRTRNLEFEIKTGKSNVQSLQATIDEESSLVASLAAKVETLTGELATDEADLKSSTEIREAEAAAFAAQQTELSDVIDVLGRAATIIEREMQNGGASMVQLKNAKDITQAAAIMVQASAITSADAARLTALVQNTEDDAGAPAGAVYTSQSGGILDTLSSLREQAEAQLSDARSKETTNHNNFQLLKQSIEDEIKFGKKDIAAAKKGGSIAAQKKATASGDLDVTSKDLQEDNKALAGLHQDCMKTAEEFEAATKSRTEELAALAAAKKAILDNTGSASAQTYGLDQVSLFQLSRIADLHQFEAVRFLRDLSRKNGGAALAQLATKAAAFAQSGDDVFAKIKELIANMIERLEDEAGADATHKAFCDKELAETYEKKADKTAEINKLSNQIDQMTARFSQLKEEVATLSKELASTAASQAQMDKLRQTEHEDFVVNKADMEQGLVGVKLALKTLREYYAQGDAAHAEAQGAGNGIIGLLEVVESDFSAGLAEMTAVEESAAADFDKSTKENQIETASKNQDVKYKNKEIASLEKATTEDTSDRSGVQSELDAILAQLKSLHGQCDETVFVDGVSAYATRSARRTDEIAGLKEALTILEGQAALLQEHTSRKATRAHAISP